MVHFHRASPIHRIAIASCAATFAIFICFQSSLLASPVKAVNHPRVIPRGSLMRKIKQNRPCLKVHSATIEASKQEEMFKGKPMAVAGMPLEDYLAKYWFGEAELYNVPNIETITQGKTTRLVKDIATGNILLGYLENISLEASLMKKQLAAGGISLKSMKTEDAKLGREITQWKVASLEGQSAFQDGVLVGDIVDSITTGEGELVCKDESTTLQMVNSMMKSDSLKSIQVSRELFKPAWLEPKVWGDEGERRRVYFAEQKYNIMRKAVQNNYRSSPDLELSDISVFERGKGKEEGFGAFGKFFQRSELKGEGSFGQVFDGKLKDSMDIILKRSKQSVIGADEMLQLELILNQEVMGRAPSVVSPFIGFIDVSEDQEGQIYDGYLSTGLWLSWEALNARTLDSYLYETQDTKFPASLKKNLGVSTDIEVVKGLAKRIFQVLDVLHTAGFVHRDIKPENLLFAEDGSIRAIDLGATASCLVRPISYEVGVGPQDPAYSSPSDLFLLPSDAPKPSLSNLEILWKEYLPDRFDLYAAGAAILQIACPALRDREALISFHQAMDQVHIYAFTSANLGELSLKFVDIVEL